MGGLLIVSVVLLPLVILVAKIRAFTDMQRLIPLPALLFLLLAGTLAFLQSTGFSNGHFWRWTPDAFHSRYTVCLCLLGTSLTVFLTLCVLAVDVFFRNHARLIRDQFPDALDEEPLTARLLHACHTIAKWMRRPLHLEPIQGSLQVLGIVRHEQRNLGKFLLAVGRIFGEVAHAFLLLVKEPLLRLGQFPFGIHTPPQHFKCCRERRIPDAVIIDVFVVHFLPRFHLFRNHFSPSVAFRAFRFEKFLR
jgi:hypothetical protein